jgi:hypothetical protein
VKLGTGLVTLRGLVSDPVHEFSFTFDREFLRAGMRRDHVWRGWLMAGLYLVFVLTYGFTTRSFDAIFVGVGAVGLIVIVWAYSRRFRILVDRTHELWSKGSSEAVMSFRLDDEGFEVALSRGSSFYRWADLRRLWRYPDVWLLEIVKMQSVLFPPSAASDAARDFIVERCRSAGLRT